MAKKGQPTAILKLMCTGGQATQAPPVGPTLSQHRVDIGRFIAQFNERTKDRMGVPLPVVIRVYRDNSFDFEVKSPPASYLVKQAAGVVKGSQTPGRDSAGTVTRSQVEQIAKQKMDDLNAADLAGAMRIIEGTARSCGVQVVEG